MKSQISHLKSQILHSKNVCLNVAISIPYCLLERSLVSIVSELSGGIGACHRGGILTRLTNEQCAPGSLTANMFLLLLRQKEKEIKILIFAFIVLLLFPSLTFAQPSSPTLKVTPIIIPLQLSPGKTITHTIELENLGNTALPLRAQFSDFEQASEDGGYVLEEQSKTSLAHWIRLSEDQLLIAPHEKKTIGLTIQTPAQIPVGGYYSLLFFESVLPKNTEGANVTSRIGVLILGDIGVFDKNAKRADILTFSFGSMFHEQQTIPLLLRIQNTSLHHLNAKPVMEVTPLFGSKEIYMLEEKYIFPGKVRRWEQLLTMPSNPIGIYTAKIFVSTGEGHQEIAQTYIIIFPFQKLLLLLLVILITWFGYKKRKHIITALKILIKG